MKFELNDYKRELSDQEIIEDIRRVAEELRTDYISISTYKAKGKYSQTAIQSHFGTWKNALAICELRDYRNKEELRQISNDDYFLDLQRIALLLGKETVLYKEYKEFGKYSPEHVFFRFNTWDEFLQAADLNPTGLAKHRISEQELFDEIERLWTKLGRQPTSTDIIKNHISKYSIDTFKRRFGGWRKALEAFVKYVNDVEYIEEKTTCITTETKASTSVKKADNKTKKDKIVHKTTRTINARLRFKVLKRDNFKCCACGASPAITPGVELHVDHIIPWSKGGETVEENLQTLCSKCNLGKSDIL